MAENKFAKYKQNKFAKYKGESAPAPQAAAPAQASPFGFQPQGMDAAMNKAKGLTFKDVGNFADSTVRTFANGVTFGFGDKAAAAVDSGLGQGNYQDNLAANRGQTEQSRETAGTAGTIAEIGGSILPAGALLKAGATATRIPGAIGKYLGMGVDGAALGGLNAAGHDQDIMTGMGYGAAGGIAGQAVGGLVNAGSKKIGDMLRGKPKMPSLDDMASAKDAAYQAVDNAGEAYSPDQMKQLAQGIGDDLGASGIDPVLNPMPYRFGEVIKAKSEAPTTLRELDKIDAKIGRKLLTSPDGEDRYLGGIMRDNISEFMNANGGSELIDAARNANKKYRNLERVLGQVEKGERRAASTGSGGNEDNAIRQNIRAILDNPKVSRFYNENEKKALEKVVTGTTGQNLVRRVGKMSPENGGLMAAMSTMGSMMNPFIGVPAAAGFVSKRIADRATKKNVDELVHLLSTGAEMPKSKGIGPKNKELIARLLMGGTIAASSNR